MLTIRHIEPTGHETVLQTMRVTMHPTDGVNLGAPTVFYDRPDGGTSLVEEGVVYVMNDLGKTVAKYELGSSAVPRPAPPVAPPVMAGDDYSARIA